MDSHRPIMGMIRRILLVDEISRETTTSFRAQSLPGHLIHVVVSGEVEQYAEGRPAVLREGNAVWYHENEPVKGRIVRAPWRFITINFEAPELAPPPDQNRVIPAGPGALQSAQTLLALWHDDTLPPMLRQLRAMTALLHLIEEIHPLHDFDTSAPVYPANARQRWWEIEKQLRMLLEEPLPLERIAAVAQMSERTVVRACQAATGMTPARRLRELRMAYATSLIQHTGLPVTEIALRVGFSRVQEFSRDYRKRTGMTPLQCRKSTPDYRAHRH
jgi:AraC-like DNA-binding protein